MGGGDRIVGLMRERTGGGLMNGQHYQPEVGIYKRKQENKNSTKKVIAFLL